MAESDPLEALLVDGEGWSNLNGASRTWHFFKDNKGGMRSLCRMWSIHRQDIGIALEQGKDWSSDNCRLCKRVLSGLGATHG